MHRLKMILLVIVFTLFIVGGFIGLKLFIEGGLMRYLYMEKINDFFFSRSIDSMNENELIEKCQSIDKANFMEVLFAKHGRDLILKCHSIDKMSCEQQNGKWFAPDFYGSCIFPTTDSGMKCTDSSQCEAHCEAKPEAIRGSIDSGMCSTYEIDYCLTEIRNGTVGGTSCI